MWSFFGPQDAQDQTAAFFGSSIVLAFIPKRGPLFVLALFAVAQITTYYFTIPTAHLLGWGMSSYAPLGFFIGVGAWFFWGGVVSLVQTFREDPLGTIGRIWRTWRGAKE